jgi:hypothetical protein
VGVGVGVGVDVSASECVSGVREGVRGCGGM